MEHRAASAPGLGLAVLSAAAFGTSGAFAASLLEAGWTPGAAVTARVGLAAIVLTVPALAAARRVGRGALRRGSRTLVLYGLVAVAGTQLAYFLAIQRLSVAVALLLEYSAVLIVVAWMWLRHQQRPGRLTILGAVVAIGGLVLVLDLVGDATVDPVGVVWGLVAAVGLATYFVISAEAGGELPPLTVAWGGMVVGGAVLALAGAIGVLPMAAPRTEVLLLATEVSWVVPVLGLSLVAAVVAYVAGIAGARRLGARLASFVGLSEVVFAVLFAWLLVGQALRPVQLVGGGFVVLGIALVRAEALRGPPVTSDPLGPAAPDAVLAPTHPGHART